MARNNKRPVERVLVASGDQSLPAAGTALANADGTINLLDGQLGVFVGNGDGLRPINTELSAGDDLTDAPAIFIAQGTSFSASPSEEIFSGLRARTHERSENIYGQFGVVWKGQSCVSPVLNAWVVEALPTPADETEYSMSISIRGRRKDEENSVHGRKTISPRIVTEDYTALALTDATDHFIQKLVDNINSHSKLISTPPKRGRLELVAFAVNTDGSAATGVALSALDALNGGVATGYGFSTDAETSEACDNSQMGGAFAAIIADADNSLDGTSKVVPIDFTTAGDGTAAKADAIIILGLNESVAYEDRIMQIKSRLDVAMDEGFPSSTLATEASPAIEGEGQGRQWIIYYDRTFGQRKFSQYRGFDTIKIILNNYLDEDQCYCAYIVEHYTHAQVSSPDLSISPHKTVILVPCADTTTQSELEAALNPWMLSTPTKNPPVTNCDSSFLAV